MVLKLNVDDHIVEVDEGPYLMNWSATEDAIVFAEKLVAQLSEYKDVACEKLLTLYNETWLDDEIGLIDEQRFKELLIDPCLTISDEIGAATVYFKDSDMFGGHWVEISLDNFEVSHVGIIG